MVVYTLILDLDDGHISGLEHALSIIPSNRSPNASTATAEERIDKIEIDKHLSPRKRFYHPATGHPNWVSFYHGKLGRFD